MRLKVNRSSEGRDRRFGLRSWRSRLAVGAACGGASVLALASVAGGAVAGGSHAGPVRIGVPLRLPYGSRYTGALNGGTQLHFDVVLAPRDPAGLQGLALGVSTPGSSLYHQYLQPGQFAQRYGAAPGTVSTVQAELRSMGLAPGPVSANGLAIPVRGSASVVEHAFSTSLQNVALPDGTQAYVNTAAPSVPSAVAPSIQAVLGLDSVVRLRAEPLTPSGRAPNAFTGFGGGSSGGGGTPQGTNSAPTACSSATSEASRYSAYTINTIASHYGMSGLYSAGDLGSGTTVAIYELEPFNSSDISSYQSCFGTAASVTAQTVDGGAGSGYGSGEAALDIENVLGLAPKSKLVVYEGPNTDSGAYDTYAAIVNADAARVITTSWGLCEQQSAGSGLSAENTLFQQAAAQGQSVFAAAGDSGSEDCYDGRNDKWASTLAVDDPASQPFVTGAGGTTLPHSGAESIWNDGSSGGAGGGGLSTVWSAPSYQPGASAREVPDVSGDADENTGYVVYWRRGWTVIGGTSAVAPLWAGLAALADSSSACAGKSIGFINPTIYALRGQSTYLSDFNDITSGNNDMTGAEHGLYAATSGYDLASGMGSPIAGGLVPYLCGGGSGKTANTVTVTNPGNQTSSVGGAVSLQVKASDSGGAALTYSATGLPAGLSINASSGLISGTPTTTTTNPAPVTVTVTDSTGATGSAGFTWTVNPQPANTVTVTNPGNQTSTVGGAVSLQVKASDSGGAALTYSATGLPAGLSINASSGLISGTPTTTTTNPAPVTVTATDSTGATGSASFTWTVNPKVANTVTVTSPGSQSTTAGSRVSLQIHASDSGGAPLTFSASGLPAGLSISSSGLISGTVSQTGTWSVTVTASDNTGASGKASFSWTVRIPIGVFF